MKFIDTLALAMGPAWFSGINLYATVATLGCLQRFGYVELPDEVRVETRLTESDPSVLRLGMEMELAVVPFRTDDAGNDVVAFAFRPVA